MIHICKNISDSKIAIGQPNDDDVMVCFCTECRELYYRSDSRLLRYRKVALGLLIIFALLLLGFFYGDNISSNFKKYLRPSISKDVLVFGEGETLSPNEAFYPTLDLDTITQYTIDFGDGTIFDSELPDSFSYSRPGEYEVRFKGGGVIDKVTIKVKERSSVPKSNPVTPDNGIASNEGDQDSRGLLKGEKTEKGIDEEPKRTPIELPVAEVFDCPDKKANFGTPCNDDDPNTVNDVRRKDCSCQGTLKKTYTWYADEDEDGKGDRSAELVTDTASRPDGYTNNKADKCPDRQARNSPDGCPTIEIAVPKEVFFGESFTSGIGLIPLIDDEIKWSVDQQVKLVGQNTSEVSLTFEEYGPATIVVDVRGNSDGFRESASKKICVQITPAEVERQIKDYVAPLGMYQAGNYISNEKVNKAGEAIGLLVSLADPSIQISNKGRQFGNDLRAFLEAKVQTRESYVNDVKVNNLLYDLNTCKVKKLSLNLIK